MRDDTRPAGPAPRAGNHQPGPPAMQAAAEPGGCMLSPLDSADAAFRALTTGPQPLALHAAALAPGLPDRLVPLDELRVLLLHPATGARARNKVWAELVRRARSGSPAWVVGLVGVAMPGLRRAAATLSAGYRGDGADLQTEILTGFLAARRGLDPATSTTSRWPPGCAGPPGGLGRHSLTPTPDTPPAAATSTIVTTPPACPGATPTSSWRPPSPAASCPPPRPS